MPTLPTLVPTGDVSLSSWTDYAGGTTNIYQFVDEGISGAVDTNDYIRGPQDSTDTIRLDLTNMPSDFLSMTTVAVNTRYMVSGVNSDDTWSIDVRVVDSGGSAITSTWSNASIGAVTSFTNSGSQSLSVIGSNDKSAWDGARVEISATYSQTKGKDGRWVQISAVEFTGTYAAAGGSMPAIRRSHPLIVR